MWVCNSPGKSSGLLAGLSAGLPRDKTYQMNQAKEDALNHHELGSHDPEMRQPRPEAVESLDLMLHLVRAIGNHNRIKQRVNGKRTLA
jgi:hypothetical protein